MFVVLCCVVLCVLYCIVLLCCIGCISVVLYCKGYKARLSYPVNFLSSKQIRWVRVPYVAIKLVFVGYRRKTRLLKKKDVKKDEKGVGAKLITPFPIEKSKK